MASQRQRSKAKAKELMTAVQSDPDAIEPEAVDDLFDADGAVGRSAALQAVSVLAAEDPDRAVEYADRVIDRLEDDVLAVRSAAALAAMALARERPDAIVSAIPTLVDALDEDPPLFRFRAAAALAPLTASHPEAFVDHADRLIELLVDGPTFDVDPQAIAESDALAADEKKRQLSMLEGRGGELRRGRARSAGTREVIANVLVEVARVDPETCTTRLEAIVPALADDEPAVRGAVVEVVRHVAERDPTAVDAAVEPLLTLLEDDAEFVRARAVRALGYAEATAAVEPLRDLAAREETGELAALAAETADWLDEDVDVDRLA